MMFLTGDCPSSAFQTVQGIPDAPHILHTQGTVVLAVAGTADAGAFLPQLAAVVGADVALVAAVMVGPLTMSRMPVSPQQSRCAGLTEVAVGEVVMLRMWAKAMRSQCLRTISGHIVFGVGVPRLPEHRVRQL